MLKCKITKLAETIYPLVMADIPVRILGPTGVGKSAVIRHDLMPQLEEKFGPSVLHDTRLSTKDIVDGTGMPIIDAKERATYWTRPAFIPHDDGKMHIMFYDEFGHAQAQLQQMAYSLVLDRGLGGYNLPKQNRVILASNSREDGGGDNKMLKPLENRMAHVQVEADHPGFLEKIKEWKWDARLIAFLMMRPELIYKVDVNNPAFPTPRSLEAFNKLLKAVGDSNVKKGVLENGALAILGEGFSRQFSTFLTNLNADLPRMADILANPAKAKVPTDAHFHYSVGSAIAKNLDNKSASKFAEYLARILPDVASMAVHDAIARDPSLASNADLKKLLLDGSGKK